MAFASFEPSLARLLKDEGGYTNHPSDPGGPTNFGITLADARLHWKKDATAADVKAMNIGIAKSIYRVRYWDAQQCSQLPAGVDYAIFDYGVNSGVGRSGKVLRHCLGLSDKTWTVTPEVVAAALKVDPAKLCNMIWTERLAFLKSLRTWPVFGKGWGNRVAGGRAFSDLLIRNKTVLAQPPVASTGKGEVPVNTAGQKGGAGSVVITGTTTASQAPDIWTALAIIAGTIVVGVAVYYAFAWWQKRQQEAPVKFVVAQ